MKTTTLRQVAIQTTLEAEEAVVELMGRYFANPPSVYTDEETKETKVTVQCAKSAEWTPARRAALKTGLAFIKECGLDIGPGVITSKLIKREDWAESWKKHFKPLEISQALLIKPSWNRRQPKPGQALVILDPGLSFGTGHHATTSFCLQEIVAARKPGAKQSFLDMGTGSGILSIAAVKLGYAPVEAFDFDPEAVRVAAANAKVNRVEKRIQLRQQDLLKLPKRAEKLYDVVCANLIFDLLVAEAGKIKNRLQPHGKLILAGILSTQFERVQAAYEKAGLMLVRDQVEKEWRSGMFVFQSAAR